MSRKIDVVKGFQTSVNIAFDLHNDSKIKNFIPTMSSIDIVEEVLHSINSSSTNRARLLVGAYGRGKSHIILVLMSLLFKEDKTLFDELLEKINEIKPELYEYAREYLNTEKKLLPVIISGNSTSLVQSFLNALQQTLKSENLDDIMPETNFAAALNVIERWENDYPDTYKRFVEQLDEPISSFIVSLKEFDVNAYEHFIELFPSLTSGSAFNPFVGFDVIELYEKVVDKLKDKGYCGIYIIYDEFSKYLESSIAYATVSDTKLLQDFAEKCNRSNDKQIHLMLISHKDISNYIDANLPKEKVDGWRGVSGRFKHISLQNNFPQMYEIISAVIKKDRKYWNKFTIENSTRFKEIEERFLANGLLDKETADIAVRGCYPLHPISTFVLPRLSEKIAQNERTLFTFLSAEQKHTLSEFLDADPDNFSLLTPDYLYDYFEPLLRQEHYATEAYKIYKLTSRVLDKIDINSLGARIIKTIALIYLIEQFEKLPPIKDRIVDIYIDNVGDISEIEETLEYLIDEECIVYLKRSNGYLKIKESSGVNIQSEIENAIEKARNTLSAKAVLNMSAYDSYMYPTAYNDDMDITRFFDFTFIDSEDFFSVDNWEKRIEDSKADGIIFAIIPNSDEDITELKNAISSGLCNHDRLIFIIPRKCSNIEKICFEYSAAKLLRNKVIDDDMLSDEYDIIIEDLEEVIGGYIFYYARPENKGSDYFYNGKKLNLKRKAQISALLSEICYKTYPNTPIINNESINKDTLPTVAVNSRSKLLAGLLANHLDINLGLSGTGQDVSFMRSTLIQTGILLNELTKPEITLTPRCEKFKTVLSIIIDFLNGANSSGKNFKELYDVLTLPRFGFGIKRGVLPIYLAVVLHHHKKYIVIKKDDVELKITSELLNSISESPELYTVFMESWSEEKTQYIDALASLFSEYISEKEKDYNSFSFVVLAMSRWYLGLPKYAKELKEIYDGKRKNYKKAKMITSHIKFLNCLKLPHINARDFLFVKLFEIYKFNGFTINIVDNITQAKELFDGAKTDLINGLAIEVKKIFGMSGAKGASLTSTVKDWYESLKPTTVNHLYSNNEDRVLQLMASVNNDEKTFIERLAKSATGLRLDDWNNKSIQEFLDYLVTLKKSILEFDRTSINFKTNTEMYKLTFVGESGSEVVKTFEKTEYTDRAKLLYNAISIELEDMGQAISDQEKRQVLMELLEKMC